MISKPFQQAAVFGVVLAAGAYVPADAALIDYSFQGVAAFPVGVTGYNGEAFSANLELDTATGAIGPFSFSVGGVGTWTGTGGSVSFNGTRFRVDWGTNYTSIPATNAFTPASGGMALDGPSNGIGFGGLVDGYPTTFNFATPFSILGNFVSANGNSRFSVALASVSGTPVPVPGAVLLLGSGLSGLAALGARRRQKASAA